MGLHCHVWAVGQPGVQPLPQLSCTQPRRAPTPSFQPLLHSSCRTPTPPQPSCTHPGRAPLFSTHPTTCLENSTTLNTAPNPELGVGRRLAWQDFKAQSVTWSFWFSVPCSAASPGGMWLQVCGLSEAPCHCRLHLHREAAVWLEMPTEALLKKPQGPHLWSSQETRKHRYPMGDAWGNRSAV